MAGHKNVSSSHFFFVKYGSVFTYNMFVNVTSSANINGIVYDSSDQLGAEVYLSQKHTLDIS